MNPFTAFFKKFIKRHVIDDAPEETFSYINLSDQVVPIKRNHGKMIILPSERCGCGKQSQQECKNDHYCMQ